MKVHQRPKEHSMLEALQEALIINENELEEECARQPDGFYRAAKEYALVVSNRDYAKQDLANVSAATDARLRHDAEVAGEKITEAIIANRKQLNKDVLIAQDILLKLNKEVGEWGALKEAFEQRSYALKDLVALWICNYYGDRPTQQAGRQMRDDAAERVKNLRKAQRR